ncbi:MAG TPA: tRNA (adenosine(37)-N6)-threonylcarbamoyltransferase complex ATPase subunit type 1 TsaE [Gemmatimonadaceae bacterium]|nr:tRNA (adenosine(37)-N6)-threonylcarbamoyltransferase complex ATPase subunit type 1 TsaE [Gemmatimonadaceae bacterium]
MSNTAGTARTLRLTEPELIAWGERFGREHEPPLVVALEGDLGAGKTTLAQAICRGFGVTAPVTSPTFALVHQYEAPRAPVYHLDLYRLSGPADLTNLGWDEIVSDRALVLVEWPDRAGVRMPPAVRLRLAHVPGAPGVRALHVDNSEQSPASAVGEAP